MRIAKATLLRFPLLLTMFAATDIAVNWGADTLVSVSYEDAMMIRNTIQSEIDEAKGKVSN